MSFEDQNGEQTVDQNFDMSFGQYLEQNMEEFIAACEQTYCLWCGRPITYAGTGRHGVFCSKQCRWAFDKHRQRERMKEKENEATRTEEHTGDGAETGII